MPSASTKISAGAIGPRARRLLADGAGDVEPRGNLPAEVAADLVVCGACQTHDRDACSGMWRVYSCGDGPGRAASVRKSSRRILPVTVNGMSSMKWILRGYSCAANRWRTNVADFCRPGPGLPIAPSFKTRNAVTTSPRMASGVPMTPASRTAGMLHQAILDLLRADPVARRLDDVVVAAMKPDVAVGIARDESPNRHQSPRNFAAVAVRLPPVLEKQQRIGTPQSQLAALPVGHGLAGCRRARRPRGPASARPIEPERTGNRLGLLPIGMKASLSPKPSEMVTPKTFAAPRDHVGAERLAARHQRAQVGIAGRICVDRQRAHHAQRCWRNEGVADARGAPSDRRRARDRTWRARAATIALPWMSVVNSALRPPAQAQSAGVHIRSPACGKRSCANDMPVVDARIIRWACSTPLGWPVVPEV